MAPSQTDDTIAARRAAIEAEVQRRIAAEETPAPETPRAALGGVQLLCTACRAISPADAQFCTHCGARFNVLVVAKPAARGAGA